MQVLLTILLSIALAFAQVDVPMMAVIDVQLKGDASKYFTLKSVLTCPRQFADKHRRLWVLKWKYYPKPSLKS